MPRVASAAGLAPLLVQELLGDLAERVAPGRAGDLLQPPLEARILAGREQLAVYLALLTRFGKRQYRIGSQRDLLLLAVAAISKPPELATVLAHQQVQAVKVRELVVSLARLGIADSGVVEHGVLALASPNKMDFGAIKCTSGASGYQRTETSVRAPLWI